MRINVINPKYLTDQHLVAEYREMKMITYYYVKSANTKNGIDESKISERYTLNKGHAYMWYNKFGYIDKRFKAICQEMRNRGNKCDYDKLNYTGIPEKAFGDFIPNEDDVRIILDRILERIEKQPYWYSLKRDGLNKGETMMGEWREYYENLFKEGKLL